MRSSLAAWLFLPLAFVGCSRAHAGGAADPPSPEPAADVPPASAPAAHPAAPSDTPAMAAAPGTPGGAPAPPGFALVELFTSEGCSSCPPADDVLADLVASARRARTPVYGLAFHVDYWDDLGWPDPFSRPFATSRQRSYARAAGAGARMYTPQMIVNGRRAFVGSSRSEALEAVDEALHRRAAAAIELSPRWQGPRLSVAYSIVPQVRGRTLNVALVQAAAVIHVEAGENAGRVLHHTDIVRELRIVASGAAGRSGEAERQAEPSTLGQGAVEFTPPSGASPSQLSVVAFLQDPVTMAIDAAARVEAAPAGSGP